MPTYSYACTVCDHRFDVRQSFTDEPLKDCPVCFDSSLRKVIHPVGISFKGSGFYKTDSRSSSGATSGTSATGSAASTSSSGGSSSAGSSDASSASSSSDAASTPAAASTTASTTSGSSTAS